MPYIPPKPYSVPDPSPEEVPQEKLPEELPDTRTLEEKLAGALAGMGGYDPQGFTPGEGESVHAGYNVYPWWPTFEGDLPDWWGGPSDTEEYKAFAEELYRQAMGEGPSAAEAQLKREAEAGSRRALALGKSVPGLTDAARLRMAQFAGADLQAAAQAQAVEARIREQEIARQQYQDFLAAQEAAALGREEMYTEHMLEREKLAVQKALAKQAMNQQRMSSYYNMAGGIFGALSSLWGK